METKIPPWYLTAARSSDKDVQLQAVQRILAALEQHRPSESREGPAAQRGQAGGPRH